MIYFSIVYLLGFVITLVATYYMELKCASSNKAYDACWLVSFFWPFFVPLMVGMTVHEKISEWYEKGGHNWNFIAKFHRWLENKYGR